MAGRILVFLVLLLHSVTSWAAEERDSAVLMCPGSAENSGIRVRMPEQSFFVQYHEDKNYNYGTSLRPSGSEGILSRLVKKIFSVWRWAFRAFGYLPQAMKIVSFALCALLIFLLVTRTRIHRLFYTDPGLTATEFGEVSRSGTPQDYEGSIMMEEDRGNYRQAVRLLYLKILKDLEIRNMIQYARQKTDREYVREIRDLNIRQTFFRLVEIYNRVWFGNLHLTRDQYLPVERDFRTFTEEINVEAE